MKKLAYIISIAAIVLFGVWIYTGYHSNKIKTEKLAKDAFASSVMEDMGIQVPYSDARAISSDMEWSDGWKYNMIKFKEDAKQVIDEQVKKEPYKSGKDLLLVKNISREDAIKKIESLTEYDKGDISSTVGKDFKEDGSMVFYSRKISTSYDGKSKPFYNNIVIIGYDKNEKTAYVFDFNF